MSEIPELDKGGIVPADSPALHRIADDWVECLIPLTVYGRLVDGSLDFGADSVNPHAALVFVPPAARAMALFRYQMMLALRPLAAALMEAGSAIRVAAERLAASLQGRDARRSPWADCRRKTRRRNRRRRRRG